MRKSLPERGEKDPRKRNGMYKDPKEGASIFEG